MFRNLKKIICFMLAFAVLMSAFQLVFASGNVAATAAAGYSSNTNVTYNWSSDCVYQRSDGLVMTFRPEDKRSSLQNPPSFNWPYVSNVESFELKICSDEALSDIKYHWEGLELNTFTPDCLLETGTKYYWSVRYFINGEPSEWSEARRFRIDPDAHEMAMENIDTIMQRVPTSHPRVLTRPEKLEEFRQLKDTNDYSKLVYERYLSQAESYVSSNKLYGDPNSENAGVDETASEAYQKQQIQKYLNNATEQMTDQLMACGFVYLVSGDSEIGNFGKTVLLGLAEWDPLGETSAANAAQANRLIAICMARAYDWLYDLLDSETEIPEVLSAIKLNQL